MERLTYRDDNGRALLTHFGKQMYCSTQATADCVCMLEERLEETISLLKEQEPVKPFVTGNGHTFEEAETWWYECGNCNEPIDPNDQYCRHCGKAVKWE